MSAGKYTEKLLKPGGLKEGNVNPTVVELKDSVMYVFYPGHQSFTCEKLYFMSTVCAKSVTLADLG